MAEFTLNIKTLIDNKTNEILVTPATTAEDVCIILCRQLGISTVARHIFALRESSKTIYLPAFKTFEHRNSTYDLRIRFKVGDILWLRKIDIKAFDYYFHQAKKDVWDNKIADLVFEKYHKELLGLGVTDMYRVMLEKDIPQEIVEKDYKKYIPKEVLKRHSFFIRKPIHDALGKIRKSVHDAWYVKEEYLKQLEMMVSEYPIEEYKAYMDQNGSVHTINVRVTPYHTSESGVKYCFDSKREKWILVCTIEELGFISIRQDGTVEICRKNGIPFYLKFASLPIMYSFVGLLDGYYRLTVKWTFNICKEVPTPSLQRLYAMKCHGPVGGEFSYAKLEVKRSNQPGCFILRESETKYNILFIDVCLRDSLKPKTYKIERLSADEFIFNDDLTRYNSLSQLMASYNDPQGPIYLAECLPPSEHDNSPLLLCKKFSLSGDSVTDGSADASIPPVPVCINTKDLQVYKSKNLKCLKWDKVRKNVKVNGNFETVRKFNKYKFPERRLGSAEKYCRNPDGDIAGPWCFVKYEDFTVKEYCDIPFCDDQDCMTFTRNTDISSHFIAFPKPAREQISFGIKLWDPDSYLDATARIVLSILPLPVTGQELEELGAGIEIFLSNKNSALTGGNKDKPEFEASHGIIKSTEYTFFNLNWDHGFLSLFKGNSTKPIFLQEYKTKHNLLGANKDTFFYYSARGNNIMWSFPFCDDDGECDVHVTTTSKHQNFYPLRQRDIGYDLSFNLRSFHSATILLVPSPVLDFPRILIVLGGKDKLSRITYREHQKAPTLTLFEGEFTNLLTFWKWSKFSVTIFSDTLQFFWTKDVGTFVIMPVSNPVVKSVRWFSPASEDSVSYWTFYCDPPDSAQPTQAYLPECALNSKETNYVGTQDVTSTGLACLPWSGKNLIPSGIHEKFKDNSSKLLDMVNYCRNPNHEDSGTFCYAISETAEKHVNKYFCSIRKCKSAECRMAGTGNDYIGKVNTTRSNRTCQYWVADLPIDLVKKFYDAKKKSNPLEDIEEDLTNPIFNSSEIIVDAGVEIKISPNIQELLGQNSTETTLEKQKKQISDLNGISTNSSKVVEILKDVSDEIKTYLNETMNDQMKFVKVHSVAVAHLNDTLYPDMSALRARNYCRNPSRSLAGSWCYTMDKDVPRDVCNVPDCDRNEECTVFLKGEGSGREVYILPQWKESGIHGGLKFAVKQWNPDLVEGIVFEIRSFQPEPKLKLVIGADNNERIILYHRNKIIKEKTLPHIILAGKWVSLWLQISRGEILLGYEGVATCLFEWKSETVREFQPIFVNYMSLNGNLLGIFFKCDECHTENTTTHHYSKIMPISIWTIKDQIVYKNLTLHLRGSGQVKIRLMHLPGSGDNYVIKISNRTSIELVKNIELVSNVLKSATSEAPIITTNSWTFLNISFGENHIKVTSNKTVILEYDSLTPLLFYYFSVAAGEKSWVTWIANCDTLDIDGAPLNGGWSKWSPWECTVSCGGGEGFRTRTCSNPRPNIFGELCRGLPSSTGKCNEFECGDLSPDTFDHIRKHLQSFSISLIVEEGKSVTIYNDQDTLGKISLESPESYYEWNLNGKFLQAEPGRVEFIGDDIVIRKAEFRDSGVYICMLHRINKERLIIHVVTLAVITETYSIVTRATLPINLDCKSVSLGYVYSDLSQKWLINEKVFIDYGITTLAAVSNEYIAKTNMTLTGEWKCVIKQHDLRLEWTTNIIKIHIKKAPNLRTHLMEDPLTRPIFGRLNNEAAVVVVVIVIIILVIALVALGLYAYLRWGRLPQKQATRKKRSKRRRQ